MTPDELVKAWFDAVESEGQETSDGVNVAQMVAKGLDFPNATLVVLRWCLVHFMKYTSSY